VSGLRSLESLIFLIKIASPAMAPMRTAAPIMAKMMIEVFLTALGDEVIKGTNPH